jgi:hypothetical protein
MIFQGAVNRKKCKESLRDSLMPTLNPGDIVMADHLRSHKGGGIAALVASVGATILYRPPYNPIEQMWIKSRPSCEWLSPDLLTLCLRPFQDLYDELASSDAIGWFTCTGYCMI